MTFNELYSLTFWVKIL